MESRFHALVQSPLRAGLLRFLCARPEESFEVESLMQTFGRMRLDVENCLRELVTFGVARKIAGTGHAAATASCRRGRRRARRCSTHSSSAAPPSATKTARPRCSGSAK